MRNIAIVFFSSILLFACSSSRDMQLGNVSQEPCRNQAQVTDQNVFTGESVDNLNVFQQGKAVYATMDVRTTCDANVAFNLVQNEGQIRLQLRGGNTSGDCVCIKKVTTTINDVEEGSYKVTVINSNNQLLAQKEVTVR